MAKPKATRDRGLRERIAALLDGGGAHSRAKDVLEHFPAQKGRRPGGFSHSAWEMLEHLRIAQRDILDYGLDPGHESPPWPDGFWPDGPEPPDPAAWDRSARAFLADLRRCVRIARDPAVDLLRPFPHAPDATWLEELLLVADHDAYHLGQLMLLRRVLERAGRRARRAPKRGVSGRRRSRP